MERKKEKKRNMKILQQGRHAGGMEVSHQNHAETASFVTTVMEK